MIAVLGDGRAIIDIRKKEALQLRVAFGKLSTEPGKTLRHPPNIFHSGDAAIADAPSGRFDQIGSQQIENVLEGFVELQFFAAGRMSRVHLSVRSREDRHFLAQPVEIEELRFARVIEVGGVVGDFVHAVDQLRLEWRTQVEEILRELGKFFGGVFARMLDDAFADLEGQIEPGKLQVALFELFDDAQRVKIVIENSAVWPYQLVQFAFPGMAKGRMADTVNQGQGLNKLSVQPQRGRDGARYLRDFQSVRQTIPEMIGETCREHLGLGFQPAERARMDDAVTVARVIAAIRMGNFQVAAATRLLRV